MRPGRKFLFSFALLALPWAVGAAGSAKNGFQLLDETLGARGAALGEAASVPGDEANGSLHNPALAAEARRGELAFSYVSGLADVTRGAAAYVHPVGPGTLAVGVRTLSSGGIPAFDAADNRVGETDASDTALTAGYGRLMGARTAWGLSLTQITESLGGRSARATALDAGVLFRPGPAPVRLSAALRNMGGKASFGREKTSLPRSMDLGASYQAFSDALTGVLEYHRPDGGSAVLRGGAEVWIYRTLALRAGFTGGREAGTGLTFGSGFKFGMVQVDYAFAAQTNGFDAVHRMGVRLFFGGPGDRAYQEGLLLSRQGRPAEAILKLEKALDADPRHPGAARALREAAKALEREMREEEGEVKP